MLHTVKTHQQGFDGDRYETSSGTVQNSLKDLFSKSKSISSPALSHKLGTTIRFTDSIKSSSVLMINVKYY